MNHIGFHVNRKYSKSKLATIEQHIEEAKKKYDVEDVTVFQIFVATPRGFQLSIKDNAIKSIKEYIKKNKITLYAHGRYLMYHGLVKLKKVLRHLLRKK